jgi:type IV pilus assembly protein PilM
MAFPRILAVDFGATAVRLVEIGPDGRGRPIVLATSEEEIAFDPAKTADFFPLYSQALSAAVGRFPSKTRACHLCLGGPATFARILKVPAADPSKVSSMIGFEAQQTVPAIEQALWDYQVLPSPQAGEVEALILAIKRETVEEMSAAAASAGLKPQTATLAPAALLNSFLYNYPEATGCHLILEIGARATTILLSEGTRMFVRVVPLGGGAVTQAIMADLQESFAGAEILKKAKGFIHLGGAYEDSLDAATARISKLARGVLTRLLAEVERSITFFRSQQGGSKPSQIWLAGGGVTLGYTDLFFQEKLRLPVQFFQPFRRLHLPAGPGASAALKNFTSWGVAVGAALQSLPDVPIRINVLGAVGHAQAQKNRDRPAFLVGAVALAGLLLLPGVHGFWQATQSSRMLVAETEKVEQASQALQKVEAENQKFLDEIKQQELALQLERERLRWPTLLEELKRHSPKGLWITGLKILAEDSGPEPLPPGGKASAPVVPKLEITGMFETRSEKADAEAVANFQSALEGGGILQNVSVIEREAPQYVGGKTDQVALQFRLHAEWPMSPDAKPLKEGAGP